MDLGPDGYVPPPRMTPPPSGWRPLHFVEPAPPRVLPVQDHAALDAAEEQAQALTRTFGLVASVVILALMVLLCGRAIF
jgi:hypothetical protein